MDQLIHRMEHEATGMSPRLCEKSGQIYI